MFNYMAMNEQQVREGVQKYGPAVGARKIIDQEYQHALETLNRALANKFQLAIIHKIYIYQNDKDNLYRQRGNQKTYKLKYNSLKNLLVQQKQYYFFLTIFPVLDLYWNLCIKHIIIRLLIIVQSRNQNVVEQVPQANVFVVIFLVIVLQVPTIQLFYFTILFQITKFVLQQHKQQLGKKFNTGCENCECKRFKFVPSRPEECGMYWLPRRKDFNILTWRPPCKCNHGCEDHLPNYPLRCKKCQCSDFDSYFACIACDRRWELHETLFEDESERQALGKKIGQEYLPLSTTPDIQQNVFQEQKYQQMPQMLQQGLVGNDKPFPKQQIQTNKQQQYTTAYTRPNQQQQKAIQQQQQTNKIVQKKK